LSTFLIEQELLPLTVLSWQSCPFYTSWESFLWDCTDWYNWYATQIRWLLFYSAWYENNTEIMLQICWCI